MEEHYGDNTCCIDYGFCCRICYQKDIQGVEERWRVYLLRLPDLCLVHSNSEQ